MRAFSIRIRLAVWYFAVLAVTFCVFSLLAFEEMRRSILSAVDDELSGRAKSFEKMLNAQGTRSSRNLIQEELTRHAGNDLIQISDKAGDWVYRSPVMLRYESSLPKDRQQAQLVTIEAEGEPLRVLNTNIRIGQETYRVQLAEPIRGYENAIKRFGLVMLLTLPVLLLVASLGGYWVSRRALEPVDRITKAAVAITAQSLSRRLEVPDPNDELRRLTETLNAMLDRLERAFKRVTRFTADASHELRTPLAYMRMMAEVSLHRPRLEEEYRDILSSIVDEIKATTDLVERLLFLARADAGSELEKTQLDLSEIAFEASTEAEIMAKAKQIDFRSQMKRVPLWINGDRESLKRLCLILIDNAIKYTPAGGEVNLALKMVENSARLEIQDTGIGIAASDLPHIFERFYRAHKARTREFGGAGLGLAIGRYIAEAHGGKIEVTSTPGQGSIFRFLVPLKTE
ncbi:ATP-binding protein [bacterium]|nr:ATP-binding protein [bacterium]